MLRGLLLGWALAVVGCGGAEGDQDAALGNKEPMPMGEAGAAGAPPTEPPVAICEAGRQVECPCPNGGKGAQACAGDGSKWEACMCADAKPPAPEKTPTEACGPPDNTSLGPEQACPVNKRSNYLFQKACLAPYLESGVCVNNSDRIVICCPAE